MRQFAIKLAVALFVPSVAWSKPSMVEATVRFIEGKAEVADVSEAILRAPGTFEEKVDSVVELILHAPLKTEQKGALLLQLSRQFQTLGENRDSRSSILLSGAVVGALASVLVGPDATQGADALQGVAHLIQSTVNLMVGAGISASAAVTAAVVWNRVSGEHQINAEGISRITNACEELLTIRQIQPIGPKSS